MLGSLVTCPSLSTPPGPTYTGSYHPGWAVVFPLMPLAIMALAVVVRVHLRRWEIALWIVGFAVCASAYYLGDLVARPWVQALSTWQATAFAAIFRVPHTLNADACVMIVETVYSAPSTSASWLEYGSWVVMAIGFAVSINRVGAALINKYWRARAV